MYDDLRNPMSTADVRATTPFVVDHTWRASYRKPTTTVAVVYAIKPCGCTGPHLGEVETTVLPKAQSTWLPPQAWHPQCHGYELVHETKNRIALFRDKRRLYGKRWFGGDLDHMFRRMAWSHYRHTKVEAERPMKPDGRIHKTAKEALERKPRIQAKLWGLLPDKSYRYDRKPKPVGYVWGKDAAAQALRDWWANKNLARALEGIADDERVIIVSKDDDKDISSAAVVIALGRRSKPERGVVVQ